MAVKIYCLMSSGVPLTNAMSDRLHAAARLMVAMDRTKHTIKGSDFEATITTKGEHKSLGCIGGIVFEATLETEQVTAKVRYIVETRDLEGIEKAVWTELRSADRAAPEPSLN